MDIAFQIKSARKAIGLTQANVAERSKVSRSAIAELESGGGSMQTLTRIAAVIDFRITGLASGHSFGEQVYKRRLRLGLTQDVVARKTGLSIPTVRNVENGKGSVSSFEKIVKSIGKASKARKAEASYWRGGQRDVRHTPPQVLDAIMSVFGDIDCDPCHDPASYVKAAKQTIAKEQDGLTTKWQGRLAFMNPPYSDLPVWLKRANEAWRNGEVKIVIGLVPLRAETRAFQDHVFGHANVLFPRGRFRFYSNGKQLGIAPFPVVLPIWGADDSQIAELAKALNAVWMVQKML
jgi:transcriptional regulator with XRE-family HTH domain